jgi:hypothetical protein
MEMFLYFLLVLSVITHYFVIRKIVYTRILLVWCLFSILSIIICGTINLAQESELTKKGLVCINYLIIVGCLVHIIHNNVSTRKQPSKLVRN